MKRLMTTLIGLVPLLALGAGCAMHQGVETPPAAGDSASATQALIVDQLRAAQYSLGPEETDIAFAVKPVGMSSVAGAFDLFDGNVTISGQSPQEVMLVANVDMRSVTLPNPMLESMVKSAAWFDVDNHPTAQFTGRLENWDETGKGLVTGQMTIRNVSVPETFDIRFTCDGIANCPQEAVGFRGEIAVRRSDYGMNSMQRMVDDEVTLSIAGRLHRQPEQLMAQTLSPNYVSR
ncbi:YceI family protein [Parvularcula sp. LCG005]|uniref:YceI family protein n=1 Tax=Parvularcula sp. LCG005 TaxID=3078805 RepID=UPI002943DAB9|nr:YceI family protein [Parvularcula sp. LCG005]WOI52300.1 YceI family protein [Parvularcula sp. LCG005]